MDILEFAIQMELDGEKYYREQAEKNSTNSLHTVFSELAEEENNHSRLLQDKKQGISFKAVPAVRLSLQNVFDKTPDFRIDINENPGQADVYRMALEKEKQSIELYKKLLDAGGDDKDLYEYLILQEEAHYGLLEDILKLVSRPDEWVESAEFGIREEY